MKLDNRKLDVAEEEEYWRLKMIVLRAQYRYHKFLYYRLDISEFTDIEFDKLEKEYERVCEHIERIYPEMFRLYAPRCYAGLDESKPY